MEASALPDNPFARPPGDAHARPLLKICGVADHENAIAAIKAGADLLGLNMWPRSKRYLTADCHGWASRLAELVPLVGVFVNARAARIRAAADDLRLSAIQLHGDETRAFADRLAEATGLPVIKALGLAGGSGLPPQWEGFPWLLLDAHDPVQRGGTGRAVDWAAAANVVRLNPASRVLLAGGLRPDNAATAVELVRPWAIDVASGAETSPGIKDPAKVAALASVVRARNLADRS